MFEWEGPSPVDSQHLWVRTSALLGVDFGQCGDKLLVCECAEVNQLMFQGYTSFGIGSGSAETTILIEESFNIW